MLMWTMTFPFVMLGVIAFWSLSSKPEALVGRLIERFCRGHPFRLQVAFAYPSYPLASWARFETTSLLSASLNILGLFLAKFWFRVKPPCAAFHPCSRLRLSPAACTPYAGDAGPGSWSGRSRQSASSRISPLGVPIFSYSFAASLMT